jgi:hypothetical protein
MIVNEHRSLLVLPNTTISYHYTTTNPYPTMTQLNPFKHSAEDMEPIVTPQSHPRLQILPAMPLSGLHKGSQVQRHSSTLGGMFEPSILVAKL